MRKRHTDANTLFHRLLDRFESAGLSGGSNKSIAEFVSQNFTSLDEEEKFKRMIMHAQSLGAVQLQMDKGDLSHLMKRVTLTDAQRLYEATGRKPKGDKLEGARSVLTDFLNSLPSKYRQEALLVAQRLLEAWGSGKRPHRIGEDDIPSAKDFVKAYSAALGKDEADGRDLRTYSRQECGDSKLIERQMSRIIAELRKLGTYGADVHDDMIQADLGLEKFPHLVQFTADIPFAKAHFDRGRHIGIHPDLIEDLEIQPLRALVTIENYASFNRYVSEALKPGMAVLYTGGWPGAGEKRLIRKFSQNVSEGVFHWGDIDMAGAAIADAVWKASDAPFSLHQMAPQLAQDKGTPKLFKEISVSDESPARELVEWLSGENAFSLEQEELDPIPVQCRSDQIRYH